MVVTACEYPKKTASFFESFTRLWRMYTNPAFIFEENVRLFDSKKTMDKAFLSIKPFIDKLKDKWVYRSIRFKLISPKDADKEYATSIQKALWSYIVSWLWNVVDENWVTIKPWFENLKPSDRNAWDVALYNDKCIFGCCHCAYRDFQRNSCRMSRCRCSLCDPLPRRYLRYYFSWDNPRFLSGELQISPWDTQTARFYIP